MLDKEPETQLEPEPPKVDMVLSKYSFLYFTGVLLEREAAEPR